MTSTGSLRPLRVLAYTSKGASLGRSVTMLRCNGGAANAVLAAWLDSQGALPRGDRRYAVSQGREVGFDARLELSIDEAGEVWSGGEVQTVVRGEIDWP